MIRPVSRAASEVPRVTLDRIDDPAGEVDFLRWWISVARHNSEAVVEEKEAA